VCTESWSQQVPAAWGHKGELPIQPFIAYTYIKEYMFTHTFALFTRLQKLKLYSIPVNQSHSCQGDVQVNGPYSSPQSRFYTIPASIDIYSNTCVTCVMWYLLGYLTVISLCVLYAVFKHYFWHTDHTTLCYTLHKDMQRYVLLRYFPASIRRSRENIDITCTLNTSQRRGGGTLVYLLY